VATCSVFNANLRGLVNYVLVSATDSLPHICVCRCKLYSA